jgi:hypothetical protein
MHRTNSSLVAIALSALVMGASACGGGGEPAGSRWDPVEYKSHFNGTLDTDFNFLITGTTTTYTAPPDSFESVYVVASLDYSHVTITTSSCTVNGDLTSVDEDDGQRHYEIDLLTSDCDEMAGPYTIVPTFHANEIRWSPTELSFLMSGQGTIPNSTSIILFYYEGF